MQLKRVLWYLIIDYGKLGHSTPTHSRIKRWQEYGRMQWVYRLNKINLAMFSHEGSVH